MKTYIAILINVSLIAFLGWFFASPDVKTLHRVRQQSWNLLSHQFKGTVKKVKTEKFRKKAGNFVTRSDLLNIMFNLHRGTIRNQIYHREKMSPRLTRFLVGGRKLRQRVLQVVKDKDSNKTGTAVAVSSPMKSRTIIYNRIYKTGSGSFAYLLGGSSYQNNFELIGQGLPDVRYFYPVQKMKLVRTFCQEEGSKPSGKIIYSKHIYFTDFSEYGCDVKYFNMMRDPLERFVSRFYFNREVLDSHQSPIAKCRERRTNNINTCILSNHTECTYKGLLPRKHSYFRIDSQIPFLCGDSHTCLTLGHPKAVETTIKSIEKNFIVIGTLDQMDKSFAVMECLIPEFLTGLVDLKRRLMIHKHSKHKRVVPINSRARKVMKERLKSEYVVYDYVRERLERQYIECQEKGLVKHIG